MAVVLGQENYSPQNNYNNPPNNYNNPSSNYNNPSNNYNNPSNNYNNPQNNYNNPPNNNNNNPPNNYNNPQNNYNNPQNNFNNPSDNYNPETNGNQNPNNFNRNTYNIQQTDQGDCCEDYCYVDDHEPYLYFGTKTAYENLNRRVNSNQHIIPECKPVKFWSINRHGTAFPDADTIRMMRNINKLHEDIIRNHEQRRTYPDKGRLCPSDYDLFKRWRFNESISERNANSLARQGVEDLRLLARRYKAKYPELLQNYDERAYTFEYSPENHGSFQAYVEGLFEQDAYKVHANIINGDKLTKPTQNCPKWQELENNQFASMSEVQRFKEMPDYKKMVVDVFRRLGYRFSPNASVIQEIYDLCRYEKAWNPQPKAPWCIAFNKNQLKLLEYVEDLTSYYKSGYGNRMAERIGCSPLKDLYEGFERYVNGNPDGNKASFIFSNTNTFQSTLVALGIDKDYTTLKADNYYQQMKRNWKSSLISPFAANLVATLYECNRDDKYRVMFFLNEVPVDFPDCSVGLCNWSIVQKKYQGIVRDCNIENFCGGRGAAVKNYATLASIFLTTLIFKF